MARLPFVEAGAAGVDDELLEAVRQRRGGRLLNLDRQLLHSAPVAEGWNTYLGRIRTGGILDGQLRELVILLVAVLNRAPYEYAQHAPVALQEGMSRAKLDDVAEWKKSPHFDDRERAALAYTEAMTLQVQVPGDVFEALKTHFSTREIVELTATAACYNMVSRFLEALEIEID